MEILLAIRAIEIDNKKFKIAYDIINNDKRNSIIFLHGWGSNKEIMKTFVNNFKEFRHIYIDMPGFGKSSNEYMLTTKEYAQIIDKLLKEINIKKDITIGHSFGGKVAILLNPQLLVLLASAGIVENKPIKVKLKIKLFKLLKRVGLTKFRKFFISDDVKGMSENMYNTFKNVVDEDFSEVFANYKGKVLIFGADNDKAVAVEAIQKQSKLLKSKNIMLSGDHYFFIKEENKKIIENKIKEEYECSL